MPGSASRPFRLDAVAICTPPAVRRRCRGGAHRRLDVLLEKPPATDRSERADLRAACRGHRRVLFTTWHSRYNAAVEEARTGSRGRRIAALAITWKEDVSRWHPDQDWIWQPGGFGVFDAGINALSVITDILPETLAVDTAELLFPAAAQTPIAATIDFRTATRTGTRAPCVDWRPVPADQRDITVLTEDGHRLDLADSGARLVLDGEPVACAARAEYSGVYAHFDALLRARTGCVDASPLILTENAFHHGRRLCA